MNQKFKLELILVRMLFEIQKRFMRTMPESMADLKQILNKMAEFVNSRSLNLS